MPPSCALLGGFAIDARVALLWQHYGNAWQSPAVIRQAQRMLHAVQRRLRMPAKTPLASDNIDAPAACAVPFRPYCGGVVTRTRNVSEYMLVLALCLVCICIHELTNERYSCYTCIHRNILSMPQIICRYVISGNRRNVFEILYFYLITYKNTVIFICLFLLEATFYAKTVRIRYQM